MNDKLQKKHFTTWTWLVNVVNLCGSLFISATDALYICLLEH